MQVFLVGGAVRDKRLGRPVNERDWVVVGGSPAQLLALGYQPVGKDFPVFLHPQTREEYALARTERKTAPGYTGFVFHAAPDVTLEQDLARRDLTINAMAEDSDGQLIDPFGGRQDLDQRVLRHVSPAFREDPVRIVRLARFAARYHSLGFRIADETLALMRTMVDDGEAAHLVPERVWKEMSRALLEPAPWVFFDTLHACGALRVILPEIDALFGVPQPPEHHPEVDTGRHTLLSLMQASRLSPLLEVRFATLVHDLGKADTPTALLPRHHGHERRSLPRIGTLCKRLRVPNPCRDLALAVAEFHTHCHRALELKASTLLRLFERLDVLRRPERFDAFLLCCEADARGRTGLEDRDYPQADYLRRAGRAYRTPTAAELVAQGYTGVQLGERLRRQRLAALRAFKKTAQVP